MVKNNSNLQQNLEMVVDGFWRAVTGSLTGGATHENMSKLELDEIIHDLSLVQGLINSNSFKLAFGKTNANSKIKKINDIKLTFKKGPNPALTS